MIDRNRDAPRMAPPKNPDASYSFGKNNRLRPDEPFQGTNQKRPTQPSGISPNSRVKPQRPLPQQDDEEPICVLKVELDGGENIQHIKVFEGQLPEEIVDEFGRKFNLSERAKFRLLEQINE